MGELRCCEARRVANVPAGSLVVAKSTVCSTPGVRLAPRTRASACESEQQHVIILVRNEGQSQLDQGNMW